MSDELYLGLRVLSKAERRKMPEPPKKFDEICASGGKG